MPVFRLRRPQLPPISISCTTAVPWAPLHRISRDRPGCSVRVVRS
jgi:hypothetical protein